MILHEFTFYPAAAGIQRKQTKKTFELDKNSVHFVKILENLDAVKHTVFLFMYPHGKSEHLCVFSDLSNLSSFPRFYGSLSCSQSIISGEKGPLTKTVLLVKRLSPSPQILIKEGCSVSASSGCVEANRICWPIPHLDDGYFSG